MTTTTFVATNNAIYSNGKNHQTHEKQGHDLPLLKKITNVDGIGPSQILFTKRDPIPLLIHSFC